MNATSLFQLLAFLFLSGLLASFGVDHRTIRVYDIPSTDSETIENVLEVFGLDALNHFDRARKVRKILGGKLTDYSYKRFKLAPGEPEYGTVLACLDEIKRDNHPEENILLDYDFTCLMESGNLPLIKLFFESGFVLPTSIFPRITEMKGNKVETINFLINYGYDVSLNGQSFCELLISNSLSVADFELYLKHGLPLDYSQLHPTSLYVGFNWLEITLMTGCIEIAGLLHEKGLRLSFLGLLGLNRRYLGTNIELNAFKLVHMMTMNKVFGKISLMVIGSNSTAYMPREMILEMTLLLLELERQEFLKKLYV